ncbi:coniferyl-alcohol dehydrogenase [Streptomyces sp. SID3343]|uniref:coniferyl-alcohol dehydrogenase n=1 Tax=Streptomyces sp. SID3343 TaxID=2690260 RepID=UPI00137080BA|nr:coniferyl-alcohol dehydrogenase [Streptomyces sp. SID3343]MYW04067.1 SDR family oxidoreductase [Streptomyces sp. SID3343]
MTNPFGYEGKRVVVTGGFSGVGAALVELLAEQGAEHITVLDLKEPTGSAQKFIRTDLSDPASVDAAVAAIEGPVHALFNNAGVAGTLPGPTVFAVNYLSLRRLTEALVAAGTLPAGAAIVNTASIAGVSWPAHLEALKTVIALDGWDAAQEWLASNELGSDPYSYSKELVQVYTMHYARTAAAGNLRINSVCPSPIDTPLLPDFRKTISDKVIDWNISQGNGRLATGRDVALALAFLGSDASGFLNGVNINLDGGFNAGLTVGNLDFSGLA